MSPERWQQIEALYHDALEQAPAARADFLRQICGEDENLRREVESLLASHDQAASFIESSPDDVVAGMMAEKQTGQIIGRTLGHYTIQSKIGAGGMGEVYRAHDTRLDRDVAVKILPEHLAQDVEALRRFEREAKAVAALSHPNILSIFDFGTEEGISYAVMELLEGETLRDRIQRGTLDWRETVEIGSAIAEGLAAAHAKNIIHRDLKPENIFLTSSGQTSGGGVKILDFGIARVKRIVTPDSETLTGTVTKPGTVMGTIGYMSPEQVRGEEADAPSDIFSLGCVLYEMVRGQRPFAHATAADTIAAILKEEPPALASTGRGIPVGLDRVIRACLEKFPSARQLSARELAQELKAISDGRKIKDAIPARTANYKRLATLLGAAIVVFSLGLLAWGKFAGKREQAVNSLAVLPLSNASNDQETEYLCDGITESIINSLSQIPALQVMSRSTVFNYKNKTIDPQEVGNKLNVSAVLTGRLTQRGDTLFIGTELVKVADGSQIWGKQFQQKLADVLTLQVEMSNQISEQLRLTLTQEDKNRVTKQYTENTEAYKLYLKGRVHSLNSWRAQGFQQGISYLNQAIVLDPTYALAHAGLAATYYEASGVWLQPNDAMRKAKFAATRALQLDETLAEAHTALGQVAAQYEWDWAGAEKHYLRALELNPNFAPAHMYYGHYLAHRGRLAEGIEEMQAAQRLDPLTSFTSMTLASYYYVAQQTDEAISRLRRIIQTDPNYYMAHSYLGLCYEQKQMFEEAIGEFNEAKRIDPEQPFTYGYLGHIYAVSGKLDRARKLLDELMQRSRRTYVDPFAVAIIYIGLGQKDEAFVWLDKACEARSESLLYYKDAPILAPLRSDKRFIALLRRMNLAP